MQGDPAALNMYGALLEREGLFRRAAAALRAALGCLAHPERDAELRNKIRLNLGRVCLSLSLHDEAAAAFSAVDPATFESLCGLAAASNLAGGVLRNEPPLIHYRVNLPYSQL